MYMMQWSLVIAGISDLARPAEKLSLTQNLALVATGTIWTRWCFVITPKNMLYVPLLLSLRFIFVLFGVMTNYE